MVVKHWWVGAKEGHDFGLVRIQHRPFRNHVSVESVELELEVVGSIGRKCNVTSIFRVGHFGRRASTPNTMGGQEGD